MSKLADKRVNSRISFSTIFALPNDLDNRQVQVWMEEIRDILVNTIGVDKEGVFIGYHDSVGVSGQKNKHLHIVCANIDKHGKALRIDKETLRTLHASLQGLIRTHGYDIKKLDEQDQISHIGVRLHYEEDTRRWYLEWLDNRELNEYRTKNIVNLKQNIEVIQKDIQELKSMGHDTRVVENFLYLTKQTIRALAQVQNREDFKSVVKSYNQQAEKVFGLIEQLKKTQPQVNQKTQPQQTQVQKAQTQPQQQPQVQKAQTQPQQTQVQKTQTQPQQTQPPKPKPTTQTQKTPGPPQKPQQEERKTQVKKSLVVYTDDLKMFKHNLLTSERAQELWLRWVEKYGKVKVVTLNSGGELEKVLNTNTDTESIFVLTTQFLDENIDLLTSHQVQVLRLKAVNNERKLDNETREDLGPRR